VSGDPWADPATPTQQGEPYAGPPPTAPYAYSAPPAWGPQPYGVPYGAPWAPLPPRGPQRPAQVVTAAVLAFVQAAVVLIASLYVWMLASIADFLGTQAQQGFDPRLGAFSREGAVLAILQTLSAALLIGAGIWALNSRRRGAWMLLLVAHAVQVVLTGYWLVRLAGLADDLPGPDGDGALLGLSLFFAAGPVTAIVLLLVGAGRHWFAPPSRP
jgi:hypothetical protein